MGPNRQMAFVFRSEDGTITGKTDTGGDIFYDVFVSGLNIKITLPGSSNLIVALDDIINVEGNSNDADSTFLYNNNQLVYADTGSSFQYNLSDNVIDFRLKYPNMPIMSIDGASDMGIDKVLVETRMREKMQ